MQNCFRVIVEQCSDNWSAWFDGFPQLTRCGESYDDAIQRLLELFGDELFDVDHIVVIEESIREGYFEVMVPLRWCGRVPPPSRN